LLFFFGEVDRKCIEGSHNKPIIALLRMLREFPCSIIRARSCKLLLFYKVYIYFSIAKTSVKSYSMIFSFIFIYIYMMQNHNHSAEY